MSGSLIANGGNISFASPITMAGDLLFDTGTGSGSIILNQTVQGPYNLTLDSTIGNITLNLETSELLDLLSAT